MKVRILRFILLLSLVFCFAGCEFLSDPLFSDGELYEFLEIEHDEPETTGESEETVSSVEVSEDGWYYSVDDVAAYIHKYGHLPSNYITKTEAQKLGWDGGNLKPYAEGKCIGGGYFGNYEGRLPEKKGRTYTECDIDTLGKNSRGAKRLVFSNDGLIYYTDDHYETFKLLYDGTEK